MLDDQSEKGFEITPELIAATSISGVLALLVSYVSPDLAPVAAGFTGSLGTFTSAYFTPLAKRGQEALSASFAKKNPQLSEDQVRRIVTEEFVDLSAQAMIDSSRSPSQERIDSIAELLTKALNEPNPKLEAQRMAMTRLASLSDEEIQILIYYTFAAHHRPYEQAFRAHHGAVLPPIPLPSDFNNVTEEARSIEVERFRELQVYGLVTIVWGEILKPGLVRMEYPTYVKGTRSAQRFLDQIGLGYEHFLAEFGQTS